MVFPQEDSKLVIPGEKSSKYMPLSQNYSCTLAL